MASVAGQSFAMVSGASADQTSSEEVRLQAAAYESILSVLMSAGYFRARIPSLTAFDKVVGGLCWCISSSGTAVDVDIFYDDDLALGAKIALAETIIRVLRGMDCPHTLQAHQVRDVNRADFNAIFPVVQWLVKKVLEHRRVTGDAVRMRSETAFAAAFKTVPARVLIAADARGTPSAARLEYIAGVGERYAPVRKYRRAGAEAPLLDADARVQSVMLEFGERSIVRVVTGEEDAAPSAGARGTEFDRKFASLQRAAAAEEEARRRAAAARESAMMASMSDAAAGVSGASLGLLMEMNADAMRRAADEYRAKEEELKSLTATGDLMANTRVGRAAAHARRVAALNGRIETAKGEADVAAAGVAQLEARIAALREAVAKNAKYNAKAAAQIAKLDAVLDALPPDQRALAEQLFQALLRSEALVAQEEQFKQSCAAHRAELMARLEALRAAAGGDEVSTRIAELTAIETEAKSRLARARAAVAERTRALAKLARAVDEIPSQDELMQYNKRFLELFDEVSEKLDETRKYFGVYNTQERKRQLMVKEESLLASILSNHGALKNKSQKAAYLEQCKGMVTAIEETLTKQQQALEAKRAARDAKAAEVQRLVEAQRAYYKAVKEFQDECDRNEALRAAAAGR